MDINMIRSPSLGPSSIWPAWIMRLALRLKMLGLCNVSPSGWITFPIIAGYLVASRRTMSRNVVPSSRSNAISLAPAANLASPRSSTWTRIFALPQNLSGSGCESGKPQKFHLDAHIRSSPEISSSKADRCGIDSKAIFAPIERHPRAAHARVSYAYYTQVCSIWQLRTASSGVSLVSSQIAGLPSHRLRLTAFAGLHIRSRCTPAPKDTQTCGRGGFCPGKARYGEVIEWHPPRCRTV